MVRSPVGHDNKELHPPPKIPKLSTLTNSTAEIMPLVTRPIARRAGKIGQPELELGKHGAIVNGGTVFHAIVRAGIASHHPNANLALFKA